MTERGKDCVNLWKDSIVAWFEGVRMSIHRFFIGRFPLQRKTRGVAFLCFILLMYGCGAEETINNPIGGGGATDITPTPTSPHYFPMTLGSRWVYRNPDSSEWSREVAESQRFDTELYHSFSYNPPIQDSQLDSLGSAEYSTYVNRLVRRIKLKDINDAVWQIILESGGESPKWGVSVGCHNEQCILTKDILDPPEILTLLFSANPHVAWHSDLTPLRFPLFPNQTYTAFKLRLSGRSEVFFSIHVIEAEAVIVGAIGNDRELVETPAGAFEDCLKIQYEAKLTSFETVEFRDTVWPHIEPPPGELKVMESTLRDELSDLLAYLMPKLGLRTMWLAPGVGPVKIETLDGYAELIDYEIKAVASEKDSGQLPVVSVQ